MPEHDFPNQDTGEKTKVCDVWLSLFILAANPHIRAVRCEFGEKLSFDKFGVEHPRTCCMHLFGVAKKSKLPVCYRCVYNCFINPSSISSSSAGRAYRVMVESHRPPETLLAFLFRLGILKPSSTLQANNCLINVFFKASCFS